MWMLIEKNGNPIEEGFYDCILVAEVGNKGKKVAYADSRMYGDVSKIIDDYRMKGQPKTGMGWIRDADGFKSETVYAWALGTVSGVPDLPEGTEFIVIEDRGE